MPQISGREALRKHTGQAGAIQLIGARGSQRVLEKVDEAAVAPIPEIHPGLRILVREQRTAADEMIRPVMIQRTLPGVPRIGGNGMRGRADGKQVEQGQFAISIPLVFQESFSAHPAVREQVRIAIQHPWKSPRGRKSVWRVSRFRRRWRNIARPSSRPPAGRMYRWMRSRCPTYGRRWKRPSSGRTSHAPDTLCSARNSSVARTRACDCSRGIQPCSAPMQIAVSPKPVAARLAISRLGPFARPPSALARSSTRPVTGSLSTQK